ncbi:MAG TPA: glycosyltransferase [Methylomirabilota bacterium]|jgi:glycosyltransferase involved in cell wall biosynthesis
MPPRVAFLTPFAFPSVRGNAVTVDRIARGLSERGVEVAVWDLSARPAPALEAAVEAYRPALIHAFHAYRTGPVGLRLARRLEVPLVVTLTGTDVNLDLFDAERAPVVRRVLEGASALVVFHESMAARITGALPDLRRRLITVPQSAVLSTAEPFDLAARWGVPPERVLFAFPAGIRSVKRPRLPLAPLGRLVARRPEIRLLYVGPVLDRAEGEALTRALNGLTWARHVGEVPHGQMASLLEQADVVLNCSRSEGGMANSVLEALTMGRAVLAADIEGNRSLIEDGVTGSLFRSERELELKAEALAADPALRGRLGAAGRTRVAAYSADREIEGYLGIYRDLLPVPAA